MYAAIAAPFHRLHRFLASITPTYHHRHQTSTSKELSPKYGYYRSVLNMACKTSSCTTKESLLDQVLGLEEIIEAEETYGDESTEAGYKESHCAEQHKCLDGAGPAGSVGGGCG
jgi:hypothetical protein